MVLGCFNAAVAQTKDAISLLDAWVDRCYSEVVFGLEATPGPQARWVLLFSGCAAAYGMYLAVKALSSTVAVDEAISRWAGSVERVPKGKLYIIMGILKERQREKERKRERKKEGKQASKQGKKERKKEREGRSEGGWVDGSVGGWVGRSVGR